MLTVQRFSTCLLILVVALTTHAQQKYSVNFTVEDGLPSSQVYDIIQDDYGYIWFSTDKGLSRYDGYSFKNYDKSDGLTDNVVFDFLKGKNGEIWCTTLSSSIFTFKGLRPTFSPYKFNDSIEHHTNNLITTGIWISPNEDLYMSFHHSEGLLHITKDGTVLEEPFLSKAARTFQPTVLCSKGEPFFFDKTKTRTTPYFEGTPTVSLIENDSVTHKSEALYLSKHDLAVFFENRCIRFQRNGKVFKKIIGNNLIIASGIIDQDHFWVGFRKGGLKIYNSNGNVTESYLKNKSITQIYIDHEQNKWFSTLNSGVFVIKNDAIITTDKGRKLRVSEIEVDTEGNIYVGYYDGTITKLAPYNRTPKIFYSPVKPLAAYIHHGKDGITYFASDQIFTSENVVLETRGSRYLKLFDEGLAFGMKNFNLQLNGQVTTRFTNLQVKDVFVKYDRLYGGNNKGLYWQPVNGSDDNIKRMLHDVRINHFSELGDQLILGTNGNGIIFLNEQHRIVDQIQVKNGLISNFVSKTLVQNDSVLWVTTSKGFNRVTIHKIGPPTIETMSSLDGLHSEEIWDILIYKDTIWVGSQKGLFCLSIDDFERIQNPKQNYFLSLHSVLVNGVKSNNKHCFSYNQNRFEYQFNGISFRHGNKLQYRYKLIGHSDYWNYTTNRNVVFSALAPGEYRFIVQVKGQNEDWGLNEESFDFTIYPPFWKTWWFILSMICLVGVMIYLFFKYRIFSYNKDIVREILRHILKRLKKKALTVTIRQDGREIQLDTNAIQFIKTDANYLEIHTEAKMYLIRSSIKAFLEELPDPIEFLQVHRSYVVRIDNIQEKGSKFLVVNETQIPVSRSFSKELDKIMI